MKEDTSFETSALEASQYLRKTVLADQYYLSCFDKKCKPTPTHETGFVYCAYFITKAFYSNIPEDVSQVLINRIISEEYKSSSLWGFHQPDPSSPTKYDIDADDTAYVLHACKRLSLSKSAESLLKFYQPDGGNWVWPSKRIKGFKTFLSPRRAAQHIQPGRRRNHGVHPEVNANIFSLLLGTSLEDHVNPDIITGTQSQSGYWPAYFYPNKYYGTYLFLDLLRDMDGYSQHIESAIGFIRSTQHADGSWGDSGNPYITALAMAGLAYHQVFDETFMQGLDYLILSQEEDGNWCSDEIIYKWFNHDRTTWFAYDVNHVVTTCLCLEVLNMYLTYIQHSS